MRVILPVFLLKDAVIRVFFIDLFVVLPVRVRLLHKIVPVDELQVFRLMLIKVRISGESAKLTFS